MTIRRTTAKLLAGAAAVGSVSMPATVTAQASDMFIGQLMYTGANFCPRGWATAQGQILSIAQNTALFSLLGTTYGGNGQTTFALPDLRGRLAIDDGQGPGLSPYTLGQVGGTETVTLTTNEMPSHTHTFTVTTPIKIPVSSQAPNTNSPAGGSLATYPVGTNRYVKPAGNTPGMEIDESVTLGIAGGSQPHENIKPYLTLNPCIALEGIFPSRN